MLNVLAKGYNAGAPLPAEEAVGGLMGLVNPGSKVSGVQKL